MTTIGGESPHKRQDIVRYLRLKLVLSLGLLALANSPLRAEFISSQDPGFSSSESLPTNSDQPKPGNVIEPNQNEVFFPVMPYQEVVDSSSNDDGVPTIRIQPPKKHGDQGLAGSGSVSGAGSGSPSPALWSKPEVPMPELVARLFLKETGNCPTPFLADIFHPPRHANAG
jgi:hypothetical protein